MFGCSSCLCLLPDGHSCNEAPLCVCFPIAVVIMKLLRVFALLLQHNVLSFHVLEMLLGVDVDL